jgi:hypothetical protein
MKNFNELPQHSRVWIYQALKEFSEKELELIGNKSNEFLASWTSHENKMDAAIEVRYKRFVIIAVDEDSAPASGCGIDKSFKFIQDLEKQTGISLLDRMQIAYKTEDRIVTCSLQEFEKRYNTKQVNDHTIVFNNLVSTKGELASNWIIPLKESWMMLRISPVA